MAPFSLEHFKSWSEDLILDSGEPWKLEKFQEGFCADVMDGVTECWFVVPEGNGKSTLLAGLALYHCAHKADSYIPIGASSRDQARIIYRQATGFVRRTPKLEQVFRCMDGYRRIDHLENGGRMEVFAFDPRSGDGVIPTLCIVDELHRHRSMDLYLTWRGKLDKRPGSQILVISTAGEPGGEFEETREKFRQSGEDVSKQETFVRSATKDWVLHEWSVPEDGDVDDLELVKRANPFSGVSVESLQRKKSSPAMTMSHWRRFTCNLPTRGEMAAITEEDWFNARTEIEIPVGEPVAVGLDLGWRWDSTAAVPLWIRDPEFRLFGPARILNPPRDGKNDLDPHLVEHALREIHERNPIYMVVMDTTKGEQMAQWIEDELGIEMVIDRTQWNKFITKDYERFMEALRMGWLHHAGDREFTRHVLNAVVRILPGGDARFERPVSNRNNAREQDRRVIDALTAAAMVHSVAVTGASVYEKRGLVMV